MKADLPTLRRRYLKVRAEMRGHRVTNGPIAKPTEAPPVTAYCIMYVPKRSSRTWRKASVTMLDRAALEKHADALGEQEGWFAWVVEEDVQLWARKS